MGYQPNVVNKGDVLMINGKRFKAIKDFNAQTDTVLKLRLVKHEKPKTIIVTDEELALLINKNTGKIFTEYGTVSDILGSISMKEIRDRINTYEEMKKAEEEIKVGDIVIHKDDKIKGVVYKIEDGLIYGTNCYLNSFEWDINLCEKIGHIDNVEEMLDKLRGGEDD